MLKTDQLKIGQVVIERVFDTNLLGETMQSWFPDFDHDAIAPHESWLCPTHYNAESGHFVMPVHSWLLRVGNKVVLIDTCIGNHKRRPLINEMHMLNTHYLKRLAEVGIAPEQIDYVLCTHLHVDHVGWNTHLVNGQWVPTFPNARYVISRIEYEAAKAEAANPNVPQFIRNCFEDSIHPVVEAGLADIVDDLYELLGCLTLKHAPGHSPGNVRIDLKSAGAAGVFAGDMLHSPVQVPLWKWSSRVCSNRDLATESRRAMLEYCAMENALLLPGHFRAPFVGRIRSEGNTFALDFTS